MDIPPPPDLSKEQKESWSKARRKIKLHDAPPLTTTQKTGSSIGDRREVTSETKVKPPVDNSRQY